MCRTQRQRPRKTPIQVATLLFLSPQQRNRKLNIAMFRNMSGVFRHVFGLISVNLIISMRCISKLCLTITYYNINKWTVEYNIWTHSFFHYKYILNHDHMTPFLVLISRQKSASPPQNLQHVYLARILPFATVRFVRDKGSLLDFSATYTLYRLIFTG